MFLATLLSVLLTAIVVFLLPKHLAHPIAKNAIDEEELSNAPVPECLRIARMVRWFNGTLPMYPQMVKCARDNKTLVPVPE